MKISFPTKLQQHLYYLVLLLFLPVIGYSQETGSCAENLKIAESLFEKGLVEKVPGLLQDCLKAGFNREESLTAYKLIIQSYLFEEKLELADSTMLAFLKKNPEYQISPTDHSSFVHLYNNFNVKPVVQISLHFGTNMPFLTFKEPVSTAGSPGKSLYNTNAFNLFASVEAKFKLNKNLELNIEAGYSQLAFTNVEDFMRFGQITYAENLKRLELPVSVTYNPTRFGKFTPYLRLGFGPSVSLNSSSKTTFNPTDINNRESHTGTDIPRDDSRNFIDLFAQAGAGIKFKTHGGYIFTEIRSNFGLINQMKNGGTSAEELRWYYYYADDDFNINSLNFSIGYTQIFYKPLKRKE